MPKSRRRYDNYVLPIKASKNEEADDPFELIFRRSPLLILQEMLKDARRFLRMEAPSAKATRQKKPRRR